MSIKSKLKKIIPERLVLQYHKINTIRASRKYNFPSEKMIMIGITGTKGKTTTANFIWSVLQSANIKCGLIGTANIKIGEKEELNKYHMTMPSSKIIQMLLSKMVDSGCSVCVMEVTSEGIKQYRHKGINFDFAVFTNLTPEHLPSHNNSFEQYKTTKQTLFKELCSNKHKNILGQKILKTIIANNDSSHFNDFLKFEAEQKVTFSINNSSDFQAKKISENQQNVIFTLNDKKYSLNILGGFNVYNALPAIIIGEKLGIKYKTIKEGLQCLTLIPGRMENIKKGQNFKVIVDYAHEKVSMTAVTETAKKMIGKSGKIIVLLGAEGGGRDKAKRAQMGEIVAKNCDFVVVSNVDPYEDDPREIIEDIVRACEKFGKTREKDLFAIEDREEGIKKALSLAKTGDIVLITGKGAEQSITIDGKKYSWDDRRVVKKLLGQL